MITKRFVLGTSHQVLVAKNFVLRTIPVIDNHLSLRPPTAVRAPACVRVRVKNFGIRAWPVVTVKNLIATIWGSPCFTTITIV